MPSSMLARSGARRDQQERRRKEKKAAEEKVAEAAATAEMLRSCARDDVRKDEAADQQRRTPLADELKRACAAVNGDDQELREFWETLEPTMPARDRSQVDDAEHLFEPEPMARVKPRSGPSASGASRPASIRDPAKTAANNARQNERRRAERETARKLETTRSYFKRAADLGQPAVGMARSVRGAEAPSPVEKAGSARSSKPAGVVEGRLMGAVADFWKRKEAKRSLVTCKCSRPDGEESCVGCAICSGTV